MVKERWGLFVKVDTGVLLEQLLGMIQEVGMGGREKDDAD